MPFKSVSDSMDMDVHTDPGVSTSAYPIVGLHIPCTLVSIEAGWLTCNARKAIFGPTPLSAQRPSNVFGTSPLGRRVRAASWIYSDLRRQKPTLLIHSCTCSGERKRGRKRSDRLAGFGVGW